MEALYTLGPFWSSLDHKDSQLNVFVSDKHFQVELKVSNFEESPTLLAEYLRLLDHQEPDYLPESDDEFEDPMEEIAEWALECLLPVFREIPPLNKLQKYTLHDCLFPEVFHYSLHVDQGKLLPVLLDKTGVGRFMGALLPEFESGDYFGFPVYRPDEIEIPISTESSSLPTIRNEVYIQGKQIAFLKSVEFGDVNSTRRELQAYAKIKAAPPSEPLNTSQLLGIVHIPSTGRIVGLLLSYIECRNVTLHCAGQDPKCTSMRQKWLRQITQSIKGLHRLGAVWGDAKPDNVLVDKHNDAYLVDFGGGSTKGWVDKELANTVEGDLQGVQRISEFLSR